MPADMVDACGWKGGGGSVVVSTALKGNVPVGKNSKAGSTLN